MPGKWIHKEDAAPDTPAISLRNVSKTFKLYKNPIMGPIKEKILRQGSADYYQAFEAVQDVSFDVQRGEVVGIIGLNGSGKTTLLKMIAGLLPVDEGVIEVNGRITALLALGVGVHPEFTGRENIYYSGLLYGMSRKDVLDKMDDIIEFADIGPHIDQPFRTYSSGMQARLLFSISMSIQPDIMIVDEALATGDSLFIQKSSERIRELCKSGATILFVSHNAQQIEQLCQKAILLDKGKVLSQGTASEQMAVYQKFIHRKEGERAKSLEKDEYEMVSGNGRARITQVGVRRPNEEYDIAFYTGDELEIDIHYTSDLTEPTDVSLFLGFDLQMSKQYVGEIHSDWLFDPATGQKRHETVSICGDGTITLRINCMPLMNNHYAIWVILYEPDGDTFCEVRGVSPFYISHEAYADQYGGPVTIIPASIESA